MNKGEDLGESVGVLTVLTVLTGMSGAPTGDDIMAEIKDLEIRGCILNNPITEISVFQK